MEPLSYAASIVGGGLMLTGLWSVIGRQRRGERAWLPALVAGFGALLFCTLHLASGVLGAIDHFINPEQVESGIQASTIVALSVTGASLGMAGYSNHLRTSRKRAREEASLAAAHQADEAAWARDQAVYDEALQRFLAYDKDLELLLAHPMMRDYGDPMVRRIMTTMAEADGAATARDHAAYARAAREFSDAVNAAEATARRVRHSHFQPGERDKLRKAQQMLANAMDRSTSPDMRREIYLQITKLLDGVITIDDEMTRHTMARLNGVPATAALPASDADQAFPAPPVGGEMPVTQPLHSQSR